jgi:tRNA-dihydrouridine synthase A
MMDRTDRHFRYLVRQITRHCLLHTEMIPAGAILRGDRERLLGFDEAERPLAVQLGGDDPAGLAECARIASDLGYDEINLNVGCPSRRVQRGRFGACLMAEPERVARAVAAMRRAVALPVTVKHRLGVDDLDRYEDLVAFVRVVAEAGCDRFIVHARKAWLGGLSARENRTVPPLRHEEVYRLKRELPRLRIEINGGFASLAAVREQLERVDGVMVGRAAYDDPYMLAGADAAIFGAHTRPPSRREVVEAMLPYIERWLARGLPLRRITRHMQGLFAGRQGARGFRQRLAEDAGRSGVEAVLRAMASVPDAVLDERAGDGSDTGLAHSSRGQRAGSASRISSYTASNTSSRLGLDQ